MNRILEKFLEISISNEVGKISEIVSLVFQEISVRIYPHMNWIWIKEQNYENSLLLLIFFNTREKEKLLLCLFFKIFILHFITLLIFMLIFKFSTISKCFFTNYYLYIFIKCSEQKKNA